MPFDRDNKGTMGMANGGTRLANKRHRFTGGAIAMRRTPARNGAATLEAILVIPVCVVTAMAFFQFGPMLLVEQTLRCVALETARETSKVPEFSLSDPDDRQVVERVANEVLEIHGRSLGDPGILVVVEDDEDVACFGDNQLENEFCPPQTTVTSDDAIKVTVIMNLSDAPVPNLLKTFCIDLFDRHYAITSIAHREI